MGGTPTIPQQGSGLADAGTAAMAQLEQHVRMLGELAARQTIASQQGATPGDAGNVTMRSMPAIPAPIVAGQHINNGQLPLEGGGSDNYGERVAADKTRLVNQLNAAATTALANKKEKDVAQKQREYEIIMTAMQGVNSPDPAVAQHNKDLLNHFFEGPDGEKRAKAISKAMGFDAFDMKAEQKKQQDPDYQAIQKAKQTVSSGSVAPNSGQVVPGGAPVAGPNGEPMGVLPQPDAAPTPSTPTTTGGTISGLNATAQQFLKNMPMTTSAPEYMPSSKELATKWRVANGVEAKPEDKIKLQSTILDLESKGLININDNITKRDIETLKGRVDLYKTMMDNNSAYKVALLKHSDEVVANNIADMANQLKSKELNQKDKYESLDVAKSMVTSLQDRSKNQLELVNTLTMALNTKLKNGDIKDKATNDGMNEEIANAKKALAENIAGTDAGMKTYMDLAGQGGVSVGDSGQGAGQRAVESFDKSSGKSNGSGQPSTTTSAPIRNGNIDLSKPSIKLYGKDGKLQDLVPNN